MSPRRARRGFTLLEVMVALAILVTSLVILMETQSTALAMTREAEKIVTATGLAQEKLAEVILRLESEGFTDQDVCEEGDFEELGDEGLNIEFGEDLDEYHFVWCVSLIDLQLAGDITSMAEGLGGSGYFGEQENASEAATSGGLPQGMSLESFGISNEQISETLSNYIREIRVVVWWGESYDQAEERGDLVEIVGHSVNPTGAVQSTGADPNTNPAAGGTGGASGGNGTPTLPPNIRMPQ